MSEATRSHWDGVYGRRALNEVSWYQAEPAKSLELIRASGLGQGASIIDVGGGASFLVDRLLREGYQDLTVLDISSEVLRKVRDRLGPSAEHVSFVQADVTEFQPTRRYSLWHDRAVFHFLVDREEQARYIAVLKQTLQPGGYAIIATFGPEGPERCSGLPVQRYAAKSLAQALGADFTPIESFIEIHHTPSGASQQFLFGRFRYQPSERKKRGPSGGSRGLRNVGSRTTAVAERPGPASDFGPARDVDTSLCEDLFERDTRAPDRT